jgi:D-tagatose-1,6-bisphosphate aldolase subunit GatZ/KbaZ
MADPLARLVADWRGGKRTGIPSICSAHPIVIAAGLALWRDLGRPALLEATCNQVNQEGGYTGMTPATFRRFIEDIAAEARFPAAALILGGDHLGPNPWKHLRAEEAMHRAEAMVAAYARAGFRKLHLDTSMACADDPVPLPDAVVAARAARLVAVAEACAAPGSEPVYVIGTEVPVPGGATGKVRALLPTEADAALRTYALHRAAFAAEKAGRALERVIALVIQPGVEFGDEAVVRFEPEGAQALSAALCALPGLVFEAHSTDYQTPAALRALVAQGFAILKVGPWLTFALREALYALDAIADVLDGHPPRGRLMAAMEAVMVGEPRNWLKYYQGSDRDLWRKRHFSYSDRIRYYWTHPTAVAAVAALRDRLAGTAIPDPLLHQYLPRLAESVPERGMDGLLLASVREVLTLYAEACGFLPA